MHWIHEGSVLKGMGVGRAGDGGEGRRKGGTNGYITIANRKFVWIFPSMAGSVAELDLLWLMRCHNDKLMLLFKDFDALHGLQCASLPLHVITDKEALYTSRELITTTTWWTHSL